MVPPSLLDHLNTPLPIGSCLQFPEIYAFVYP